MKIDHSIIVISSIKPILAGNSKPNVAVINLDYDYDKVGSNVILFSNSRRVQQTNLVR